MAKSALGRFATQDATMSSVSSVDPSSTTNSSNGRCVCVNTLSRASNRISARLNVGTTTLIFIVALSRSISSKRTLFVPLCP